MLKINITYSYFDYFLFHTSFNIARDIIDILTPSNYRSLCYFGTSLSPVHRYELGVFGPPVLIIFLIVLVPLSVPLKYEFLNTSTNYHV